MGGEGKGKVREGKGEESLAKSRASVVWSRMGTDCTVDKSTITTTIQNIVYYYNSVYSDMMPV